MKCLENKNVNRKNEAMLEKKMKVGDKAEWQTVIFNDVVCKRFRCDDKQFCLRVQQT